MKIINYLQKKTTFWRRLLNNMDIKPCENCSKPIGKNVAWYSLMNMGHELCLSCQILFKKGELTDKDLETQKFMDKVENQKFKYGEPNYKF